MTRGRRASHLIGPAHVATSLYGPLTGEQVLAAVGGTAAAGRRALSGLALAGFPTGFRGEARPYGGISMSKEPRLLAGVLLITFPTVVIGGVSVLSLRAFTEDYARNPLRQDLWRAGHAHAGVFLLLALVVLRYVDGAALSKGWKWLVRLSAPTAAILLPGAFFLSVLSPAATEPNALIYLGYIGGAILALGLFVLGIGLVRRPNSEAGTPGTE